MIVFFFLSKLLLDFPDLLRSTWNKQTNNIFKIENVKEKVYVNIYIYISKKFLERKNDLWIVWESQPGSIMSVQQ